MEHDEGYRDVMKAVSTGPTQVMITVTGFAESGARYELTKTEDGFKAEKYD